MLTKIYTLLNEVKKLGGINQNVKNEIITYIDKRIKIEDIRTICNQHLKHSPSPDFNKQLRKFNSNLTLLEEGQPIRPTGSGKKAFQVDKTKDFTNLGITRQ